MQAVNLGGKENKQVAKLPHADEQAAMKKDKGKAQQRL